MRLLEIHQASPAGEDTVVDLDPRTMLHPRRAVLVALEGGDQNQTWVIDRDAMTIGRDPSCPVSLRDPTASRRHSILHYTEPDDDGLAPLVVIADMGSTNGTVVNGTRIEAPCILKEHDRIRIGATVLTFELRDVRQIQAETQLRQMAMHDALTGLYNRAVFDREFQREFERCRRYGRPFTLALFDIDHFKQVNDVWGHLVGDEVLRAVGHVLRSGVRETDSVARYGGEEFAVILPETTLEGGHQTAERLRQSLRRVEVPVGAERLKITASGGLVGMHDYFQDALQMLAACDRQLYKAKERGRDRICVWRPPQSVPPP